MLSTAPFLRSGKSVMPLQIHRKKTGVLGQSMMYTSRLHTMHLKLHPYKGRASFFCLLQNILVVARRSRRQYVKYLKKWIQTPRLQAGEGHS